ncbi:formimidoylglutamate deiminase [Fulvimarina endophytica]|uniref:Formimidoylglutamate deiminase n=1 Tax=Fulvimarina endophytica TaxID=2293836 RepID=A0A371WYZ4_9HYPH|nr:formimidoylglutamate deiminase [Fulvimarina endophytica]RFC62205.1 formimidoylglutamate deiminase [Fulvimarina endophytica]
MRIHAEAALLPDGWTRDVTVEIGKDGAIASVVRSAGEPPDHSVAVLLPAVANLHSHTFQRAMAGMTETRSPEGKGDSFWTWRTLMYRFLDILTPDEIEAVARFAFMEMLEAGYGAVAEFHYLHHAAGGDAYGDRAELAGRIVRAAGTTGIGLTLLPVYYQRGGLDGRPLAGGQLRFGNDLDGFARLLDGARHHLKTLGPDARLGLAPHSLRAASAGDIAQLAARMPESPIHLHIAEQEAEVAEVEAATGRRPVEWLLESFDVDERWCLVHATQMTPSETEAMAKSGAIAGLCPVTEANLGDGTFPASPFLAAGGRFGVGTDSNVRISLAEELRQLEYSQRLLRKARSVLAEPGGSVGRFLYEGALAGGSAALGRESGRIEAGCIADLMSLRADASSDLPDGDAVLDGWIFAANGIAVDEVWSAGRHVVEGGVHHRRDEIAAAYRAAQRAIRSRL